MAQLNDLIVLGNSNLVGETNINGNLNINSDVAIKNTLSVEGTTYLKNNIELTRTSNTNNPYLKLTSSSGSAYLQLNGTSVGLGNGWTNSLQIDNAGNASLPGSMTAGGTTIALGASANIIGTTRQATTISNQLVLQKGAVFSGTAADAGLVTRGICGVSTPDSNGACSKENLYINYDNDNTYRNNRQLVLQAGTAGTHYGSNLYQYAAARGDAVKGWVENSATSARTKLLETFKTNSTTDTYGTSWNFLAQWINSDRLKFKVINGGTLQDSYPIEVDHAYKLVASSTDKNASTAPLNIGSTTQPVYFSDGKPVAITGTIVTSDELDEVKTSVSEGKTLIAAAVTDKGVQTAATDSFQTIANNISNISTPIQFENLTLIAKSSGESHPYDNFTSSDSISVTIPDDLTYLVVIQSGFHNSSDTAYTNAGSFCSMCIVKNKTIISKWAGTVYHHSSNGDTHTWCGTKENQVTPTITDGILTVTVRYEDISSAPFDDVEEVMGYFLYRI